MLGGFNTNHLYIAYDIVPMGLVMMSAGHVGQTLSWEGDENQDKDEPH